MPEAGASRRSVKNVFLEISQNSQENICVGVFFNEAAGLWQPPEEVFQPSEVSYKKAALKNFEKFTGK